MSMIFNYFMFVISHFLVLLMGFCLGAIYGIHKSNKTIQKMLTEKEVESKCVKKIGLFNFLKE